MAIPKYKKQYQEMIENNKEVFEGLKTNKRNTDKFKEIQRNALRIVRRNEDALCKKTENTHYNSFSLSLGDKFMEEVRANYPEIDFID